MLPHSLCFCQKPLHQLFYLTHSFPLFHSSSFLLSPLLSSCFVKLLSFPFPTLILLSTLCLWKIKYLPLVQFPPVQLQGSVNYQPIVVFLHLITLTRAERQRHPRETSAGECWRIACVKVSVEKCSVLWNQKRGCGLWHEVCSCIYSVWRNDMNVDMHVHVEMTLGGIHSLYLPQLFLFALHCSRIWAKELS